MASRSASSSGRSTISGRSSICEGTARECSAFFKRLVDQPLMRRMLVDDDERIPGLRDDVVLMHLRARRTQRRAEQRLGRLGLAGTRIGAGQRPGIEGRLIVLAKAATTGSTA